MYSRTLAALTARPGACMIGGRPVEVPTDHVTATFSIVAADPETGVCGAAVASKYPAVGKVVPYVRAGVGAFCTQHWHNPSWGEKALDLLEQGKLPEEVLGELIRDDPKCPVAERNDCLLKRADGNVHWGYHFYWDEFGGGSTGDAVWLDFSKTATRQWWAAQHAAFLEQPGMEVYPVGQR